ncbi:hypothetical protein [Streptomyces sp. NPDC006446]
MGAHDSGVDRDDPIQVAFGVGLGEQGSEDALQVPSIAQFRSRV